MPKQDLESIKNKMGELTVTLYEFFIEEMMLSWKPLEVIKKKKHYEITFYSDCKRDLMCSELPEVETLEIKIDDAPDWSYKRCTLHEIDGSWVFMEYFLGQYKIPKTFTESILSDILGENVFILGSQEVKQKYD